MAIPSSLSLDYDAVLSTSLFKIMEQTAVDNISTANAAFYYLNRRGAYRTVGTIGDRMQVPLMYELGSWDAYSNYDQLDVTPADGVTSSFYEWGQSSVPVVISGLEKKKNKGTAVAAFDVLIRLLKQRSEVDHYNRYPSFSVGTT